MKKLSILFAILAVCGLVVFACGDDDGKKAHCETIVTCDPACDNMNGEICCGTTCQAMETCDPACEAPAYCDPCAGTCVEPPAECDPACDAATEYCDDGTCKEKPICDPACDMETEYCTF